MTGRNTLHPMEGLFHIRGGVSRVGTARQFKFQKISLKAPVGFAIVAAQFL
jgi:hypothetical protein